MPDGDWLLMFQSPTRSEEVPEEEQEEKNEQQPVGFQDTLIHTDRQTVNQSTNQTDGRMDEGTALSRTFSRVT